MDVKHFLRNLSESSGVSGYEQNITEQISTACTWADDMRRDKLGNLIMLKRGEGTKPKKKIMLAAHMDEIGLIITKVEKGGFLRFGTIGGFDQRVLLGQEVIVHGKTPSLGIIGAKPPTSKPTENKIRPSN